MKNIIVLLSLSILTACAAKASNELEDISKDVLKYKQGIEIDVKPISKN